MNAAVERFHARRRGHIQVLILDGFGSELLGSRSVANDQHTGQQHRGGVSNESSVSDLEAHDDLLVRCLGASIGLETLVHPAASGLGCEVSYPPPQDP